MAGVEPRRFIATARAAKLLISYGIERPSQIVLEDIAWDLGVEIYIAPLSGAAAHLVRIGDSGTITVSNRLEADGRVRFAIAHELGHWCLHQGISQLFLCTGENMRDYVNSGPELEANIFACELLMPRTMLDKKLWKLDPGLWQPKAISTEFGVSLTSGALRWAEVSKRAILAVFSDGKNVLWWRRNDEKTLGLWCSSKQQISPESRAYAIAHGADEDPNSIDVPWEAWFPHIDARSKTVQEMSIKLGNYSTIISMLWIPEMD